jgi:hypothetical protein
MIPLVAPSHFSASVWFHGLGMVKGGIEMVFGFGFGCIRLGNGVHFY